MSGGVDSSVIAHLLHAQGHELIGVMMKLWVDPLAPEVRKAIPTKCCSLEHIQRARQVCKDLDIPFYVLNIEDEFKREVVDPFIKDYKNGKTPNPCIECNRNIKFGTLLEKMRELECDKLATGHYARIIESSIYEALDKQKDQSYYLYGIQQDDLHNIIFPLGDMTKDDVFDLAMQYSVPLDDGYRESQDLCFYPEKEPSSFIKRYIDNLRSGPIVDENGDTVGQHNGLPLYTIGQRKGLGIGGLQIPLYVERKDIPSNTLYVASNGADMKSYLTFSNIRFFDFSPIIGEKIRLHCRVHSLGAKYEGDVVLHQNHGEFYFQNPVRGIAPGQSIVLYSGDRLLGGGVIQ